MGLLIPRIGIPLNDFRQIEQAIAVLSDHLQRKFRSGEAAIKYDCKNYARVECFSN